MTQLPDLSRDHIAVYQAVISAVVIMVVVIGSYYAFV